ncbi:unnamed protein product [Cyprideis torosa]|uniref:Uncharacterized protein n=1 Tax=Cyprideis torosa TaxID=163714 RepID=A0A7R8W3X9_9CRUS|nr:unnamed protein product [Cyprideis torosa]CAG0883520.1 unnamed protein product [Cyprideis torosa]
MMRGGPRMAMRGRGGGGMMRRPGVITHFPFDTGVCRDFGFEESRDTVFSDDVLQDALLKRNNELSPTPQEQGAISNLVNQVQSVLDNITVSPGSLDACTLEEVRQVGSYKKGTMLHGKNVGDIVVILRTLPTSEAVDALMDRVSEELSKLGAVYKINLTEGGFEVAQGKTASVQILVTTVHQNFGKLDPTCHLSPDLSFKRVLQLLAAGLLLPGSVGICDPCEGPHVRIQNSISAEDQDAVTSTAQTLLRVLAHGGYKQVLGFEGNSSIASVMSVWDGVVVTPGPKVYEKPNYELPSALLAQTEENSEANGDDQGTHPHKDPGFI